MRKYAQQESIRHVTEWLLQLAVLWANQRVTQQLRPAQTYGESVSAQSDSCTTAKAQCLACSA